MAYSATDSNVGQVSTVPAPVPAASVVDPPQPDKAAQVIDAVVKDSLPIRIWLYGVTAAAMPVLAMYGVVNGQQAEVWTTAAAAVLGITNSVVAIANISKK